MKDFPVRKTVVAGALGAVSIVLAVTPLGFLPWFGGVSLTVMHIPVIVAAVLEGPVVGMIVGLIFGATSLVKAATAPLTPFDPLFTNVLVSVLPRLLVGPAAWFAFASFRGKARPAAAAVAGIVGSLVNTVLVLFMLWLVYATEMSGIMKVSASALPGVLLGILAANGLPEAVAAAVLTAAIVVAWKGIEGTGGKSRLSREG